jgi:hypothetical protein
MLLSSARHNMPLTTQTNHSAPTSPLAAAAAYPAFGELAALVGNTKLSERKRMERALIRINRWRQSLLINTYRARQGQTVHAGPFAGMTYTEATEGATLPRLIGCYEAELQPTLLAMSQQGYEHVIDIGCAEGYYAVGLARLFEGCDIYAHDISEAAQRACQQLAVLNQVQGRVKVGGIFDASTLAQHRMHKTLVFCDIEGAEDELLNPQTQPGFTEVDLIVEVHECFKPGLMKTLSERFSPSHEIEWIWQSPNVHRELPDWVKHLPHLDQVLCTWEWRAGPTPWAVMRRRQP